MMTLREFLEKVNFHEHYRIYQPNRDCLIFESYLKIHSPYSFLKGTNSPLGFKHEYFDDNEFCDDVRLCKEPDEETKEFLDVFGDYKVFSLEIGSFRPSKQYRDEKGDLQIEHIEKDPLRPSCDYIDCFNVFIIDK